MTLELQAGDYRLGLTPEHGGSIAHFTWRGEPLFRRTCGPSILQTACFPLVPFSNRIAFGRFTAGGRNVTLAPNFPGGDHPHTLHGFGWLAAWSVVAQTRDGATVRHDHPAGEWPWAYRAEQCFRLSEDGLEHRLSVTNLGRGAMPAGLGAHPYFPRTDQTRYHGRHRGEWRTAANGLPQALETATAARDWWDGVPVATRIVDTAYAGREGALAIEWPERRLRLTIEPSPELGSTSVYVPPDANFFCVEPVSHATNAINRMPDRDALCWLAPAETFAINIHYTASTSSSWTELLPVPCTPR